jgi:hypothetical protein
MALSKTELFSQVCNIYRGMLLFFRIKHSSNCGQTEELIQ